jgi:hypothetical protein
VTRKQDSARGRSFKAEDLKKLLSEDRDLLKTIVEETLQQVLEAEMDEALQASKGERTAGRLGYRAGYYNRMLATRVGHIELRVPQDRQGRFRTEVFERYQRSEKALVAAMLEMYVQGVSTRKVKTIIEEVYGHEFSSSTISRMVQRPARDLPSSCFTSSREPMRTRHRQQNGHVPKISSHIARLQEPRLTRHSLTVRTFQAYDRKNRESYLNPSIDFTLIFEKPG